MRHWGRRWRTADADPFADAERQAHAERRALDRAPAVEVGDTDTNSRADPVAHAEYAGHNPTVGGGVGVCGGVGGGVGVGVGVGVEDSHGYGSIRVEARSQDPGRHHDDGHDDSYGDGDDDRDRDRDHDHPGTHAQPHRHVSLTQPADEPDRERDPHDLGHTYPVRHADRPGSDVGDGHDLVAVAPACHRGRWRRRLVVDETAPCGRARANLTTDSNVHRRRSSGRGAESRFASVLSDKHVRFSEVN